MFFIVNKMKLTEIIRKQKGEPFIVQPTNYPEENEPDTTPTYLPPCTLALVIINVILFLITDFSDMFSLSSRLFNHGALSWQSVIYDKEYYRLITCMFLHDGIDHIFNNMIVLYLMGSYLEQHVGSLRYLVIYFSSGILAGCTSMVYNMVQNAYISSVGASGAIFGLTGGILGVVLLQRKNGRDMDLKRLILAIFLSLYSGFMEPYVDNAAHVGGFVAGFLITIILCFRERQDNPS